MIKTILVPATGTDVDRAVFASALAIARPFAAHLDFLHVRVDAISVAMTATSEGGTVMMGGLLDRLEEEGETRERRARQIFDEFCARERLAIAEIPSAAAEPSAQWLRQMGREPYWVAEYGRAADLMVIGRPIEGQGVAPETIETAVLESGRPLLIPPATTAMTAPPETIVIAWKATREAAHAVTAAAPFLDLAKDIHVVTVAETEDLSTEEGSQLMTNLRWRGLRVSAERLPPDQRGAGDTLLGTARDRRALLVMGGYGHSWMREWIFGGFTQDVLQTAAAVPILIVH
ncbi:MAG TPA: universal stress protein [Stellaceae bacterium]|nr:universal stress protein [Stellaceae bacterium]